MVLSSSNKTVAYHHLSVGLAERSLATVEPQQVPMSSAPVLIPKTSND